MYTLPSGFTVFRTSNNGDQLTAQKDSTTSAKPKLIILDRSAAVFNSGTQSYSVPEFRVRVMTGTVDSDGMPRQERLLADMRFRTPIGSETDAAEWKADILALLNESDFFEQGVNLHSFPTCCSETPEE